MRKIFPKKWCAGLLVAGALVLISSCNRSQEGKVFTISGSVPPEIEDQYIYATEIIDGSEITRFSGSIVNGKFCIKGHCDDTVALAVVHLGDVEKYPAVTWNVALEKGDIVLDTNGQFATGTPNNDGMKDWMLQIYNIMMTSADPNAISDFFAKNWALRPTDFVGAYMLMSMSPYMEFGFVDSLARQIPAEMMQKYLMFRKFDEQLATIRKMQPGCVFTDVEVKTLDGEATRLSDHIGKGEYVLVDFWASWCGPCRQAMPQLQAVAKKHKELKVIGIAVSDEVDDTRKAIGDLRISWPVLSDTEALSAKTYGINAIPAMILFAPDGKIVARDFNVVELENILSEQMK